MADISQVKLPDGTTYNLKDSYVRTNYRALDNNNFDTIYATEIQAGDLIVTGSSRFLNMINGDISGSALKATQDGSGNVITSTYVKKSGGTMTGLLKAQANIYTDSYTGALDMQNSNIYGVNSIITADLADNAGEGIHFYRDSTHVDTLWVAGGDIMFVPNRALGTSTTAANSQKVGRFTVNPTSGQVVITDGTTGGVKSSGYTIGTSVPSSAVFTDQYVSQTATTTSDWRKIVLSFQNDSSAGAAVTSNTNVVYVTANAEIQPSTGSIRTAGNVTASGNVAATGNVTCAVMGLNQTNGTAGGISLYGGSGNVTSYGLAMRTTGNSGKHGYVQGDWGTYLYMAGATNRGWIFQNAGSGNRTSISCEGHIVTNGSLTLGGNTTNTSGVRQVYNSTTQSLDFVFV